MKRRLLQTLITVVVMSSLIVAPVIAAPKGEVQALKEQKAQAQEQVSSVNSELVSLLVEYNALQSDIATFDDRIAQAEADYNTAKEDEEKQYEDMKLRIKYMYEQGDATFFETLASSKSYADLVNKAEYVQNVHDYDRNMLDEYVKVKEEVADLKEELETNQAEMEFLAEEMGRQKSTLENTLTEMKSRVSDFDSQLQAAKEEAAAELERMETDVKSAAEVNTGNEEDSNDNNTSATPEENVGEDDVSKPSNDNNTSKPSGENSEGNNASKPSGGNNASKPSGGNNASKPSGGSTSKPSGGNTSKPSGGSASKPSNAALGQQIAAKGQEYIGNPYVYGGNSLTNGIDCSGFVQQIHKKFGISTPRSSSSLRYGGKAVNYADKLPGDVICYSGHVAIYIGGNTIVHASNSKPYPKGGIKTTSPANYKTVLAVRRYW